VARVGGLFTLLGYAKIAERSVLMLGSAKRNTRRMGNEETAVL
jgi:hypothetical protein